MPGKKRCVECECACSDDGVKSHCAATDTQKPETEEIYEVLLVMQSMESNPEAIFLDWKEFERLAPEMAAWLTPEETYNFTDNSFRVTADEYKSLVPKESDRLPHKTTYGPCAQRILFRHGFQDELAPSLYVSFDKAVRVVRQAARMTPVVLP